MICAIVKQTVVCGVVEITEEEYQRYAMLCEQLIDVSEFSALPPIGATFNNNKFQLSNGQEIGLSIRITKLGFAQRFTDAELAAIEGFAAQSNAYAYALRGALRKQSLATFIDLALPETISGVQSLVAMGLITGPRCAEILSQVVQEKEKYREQK